MLVPGIRRRRCLPEAHRNWRARTPDARSREISDRGRAGAFRCGNATGRFTGLRIGCSRMAGSGALRGTMRFLKKRGWPPAALSSVRRSRRLQGSPVRPATADVRDTVLHVVELAARLAMRDPIHDGPFSRKARMPPARSGAVRRGPGASRGRQAAEGYTAEKADSSTLLTLAGPCDGTAARPGARRTRSVARAPVTGRNFVVPNLAARRFA
jgi:hypothetical protein